MVIDTSVLIALLFHENEWRGLAMAIERDSVRLASAASILETYIVTLARLGQDGTDELELLQSKIDLKIHPVGPKEVKLAQTAYQWFGKGRHPAALNFGDCFSYACAKSTGESLLFKGNDFSQTDIPIAEWTVD
jgi:ribonuclease VapC